MMFARNLKSFGIPMLMILFLPVLVLAGWGDRIEIFPGGNTADICVDRNSGMVHMVFYRAEPDQGLVYTKTDEKGNILMQDFVPGTENDSGGYRFSATVAVDTQGNPHLTYRVPSKDSKYDGYYIYYNGTSWSNPLRIFSGVERGNQMRMAIDDQNRVHIIYPNHKSDSYATISYCRIVNGSIDIDPHEMTGMYEHRIQDHIEIDVSRNGYVYFALGYPPTGDPLVVFRSTDGGSSFQPGFDLRASAVASNSATCGSPDVFVGEESNVAHFCYGSDRDSDAGYKNSVRYARWENGERKRDKLVTGSGELDDWGDMDFGIGSVAASDDGKYVMIIYSKSSGGELRYRLSENYGEEFSYASPLASSAGGYDGRDKAKIRSYYKRFYTVYTMANTVYLQIYSVPGYDPPVANAGGPYSGKEGTPVTFDASKSTDDAGLANFEWDFNNDGTYEESTTSLTLDHTFADEYSGTIKLRVTDESGLKSVAETTVNITNANPVPNPGSDVTGNEGTAVNFSVSVTDPGVNDTHTFLWDFGDGTTSTQQNPSHAFGDNGTYTVKVTATDNDGGAGQAQISATISNVAPTANAGGPYNGSLGSAVTLSGSGTDPAGSNDVLSYAWDINNDGAYDLNGQTVDANFSEPGQQTIKLRVSDEDGGEGFATTTVNIGKASPVISNIATQVVNEGTPFPVLNLDDYVVDLDTPDNQLVWSFSGNDSLYVTLDGATRKMSVSVPYDEWHGSETITLTVNDPDQHSTQTNVTYTVNPVNDAPQLGTLSDPFFNEDDSTIIYRSNLVALVTDPDSRASNFVFSVSNNFNVKARYDTQIQGLVISAKEDWNGNERVTLKVADGDGGSDSKDFTVYVIEQPDPPKAFSLISPMNEAFQMWPASIQFRWTTTTDPDGDAVTYRWVLSRSESFLSITEEATGLTANSFTFNNTKTKKPGPYYWRIEAISAKDGLSRNSTEYGVLNFNSKEPTISYIPEQTIKEGSVFPDINLDNFITDADNSKDELVWRYEGNVELVVEITGNRVLKVSPPNDKWYGSENIRLIVTDPTALSDSSTVKFTVTDVNAKPVLAQVPNQSFDEDYVKKIDRSLLESWATDEDNSDAEFSFKLVNNQNIKYSTGTDGSMTLYTDANWCGEEEVTMVVEDGAGKSDSSMFTVKVNCIPDPPEPFDLISPSTTIMIWTWPLRFQWQEVVDPDPNEQLSYLLLVSTHSDFRDTLDSVLIPVPGTNYYDYMAPYKRRPKQTYFWKMFAFGMDGLFVECSAPASFTTMWDGVETIDTPDRPTEFTLYQNHPNPFNPETKIRFDVPETGNVKITIFNSIGQKVRELVNEEKAPGVYEVRWDARDEYGQPVSSGIYMYRLRAGDHISYRKMLFLQ